MAYDKNTVSGTIFDEVGYDEMQKSENHEIGFRLFRVMFLVVLIFSMVLVMICGDEGDIPGMVVALVLFAAILAFYLVYAYMTAKKGIMNPKFAKTWANKGIIPIYIVLALVWAAKFFCIDELSDLTLPIMWLIMIAGCIGISLCARKNNRVVKKQLEEE